MTALLEATRPEAVRVKERRRRAWTSRDFAVVDARMAPVAEQLCDSAGLQGGWRVLDVATGTGNAAIAAARLGCTAVGVDYVPALLDRGRVRAAAEGLEVELLEGDAESLPFPDASFDAVTSVFGCMFAPDHERAAAELARVCRPGGTLALASWTPDGFVGELFNTVAAHVPPPAGVPAPMLWGTEGYLLELFGERVDRLELVERTFTFRFSSVEQLVAFFRRSYGPTVSAFASLDESAGDALERGLVSLTLEFDRLGTDAIAVPATYGEAVARAC